MKNNISIFLACCLLCTSCAYKTAHLPYSSDVNTVQASQDSSLACFIGNSAEGETRIFEGTSFGESISASVGNLYFSAHGFYCRKASIITPTGKRVIAACKEGENQWIIAPEIFVSGVF